jgi:probable rRNA maturation factor
MVNNMQDKIEISEELLSLLEEIGNFLLRLEGQSLECEVSIILVDNSYIQELNLTYRGYDSPTDVLSFNLQDNITDEDEDRILGDVVVSVEKAEEQAKTYGHTLRQEIAFLSVHGILHLLGYDHETAGTEQEMNEKQELALKKFKLR